MVMALGVPFYVSTGLGSYLELSNGGYRLVSARATVQSVGLIAGTCLAYWTDEPIFLAWGFTGAYMAMALWSQVRLRRIGALADVPPDDKYGQLRRFTTSGRQYVHFSLCHSSFKDLLRLNVPSQALSAVMPSLLSITRA